jgi:hypothetical protein
MRERFCIMEEISTHEANNHLQSLLTTIEWKNDEAMLYGKHFITARKSAFTSERQNKKARQANIAAWH